MKRLWLALAVLLGLAAQAAPASADLLFTLRDGGSIGGTGNYGTVRLHQVGTGSSAYVTVTVTLAAKELFVHTGAGSAFEWNIKNNPSLSSVTVTSNPSKFTVDAFTSGQKYKGSPFTGGNCNQSGAGCFQYAIEAVGSGASQATENKLVFDVKKTGGLLITDFVASNGYYFAADIGINCSTKTTKHGGTETVCGSTGMVAVSDCDPPVYVPEPGTLAMSMSALAGLLMMQRRRRKLARA